MTKVRNRKRSTAFVVHNSNLLPKLEKNLNCKNLHLLGSNQNSTVKCNVFLQEGLEIQYPIMTKAMSDEEIVEYHLKKLYELSKPEPGELEFRVDGSIWKNGKLIAERPTEEQERWYQSIMRGPAWTWKRWYE